MVVYERRLDPDKVDLPRSDPQAYYVGRSGIGNWIPDDLFGGFALHIHRYGSGNSREYAKSERGEYHDVRSHELLSHGRLLCSDISFDRHGRLIGSRYPGGRNQFRHNPNYCHQTDSTRRRGVGKVAWFCSPAWAVRALDGRRCNAQYVLSVRLCT